MPLKEQNQVPVADLKEMELRMPEKEFKNNPRKEFSELRETQINT